MFYQETSLTRLPISTLEPAKQTRVILSVPTQKAMLRHLKVISLVDKLLDLLSITRASCMACGPGLDTDTAEGTEGRAVSPGEKSPCP